MTVTFVSAVSTAATSDGAAPYADVAWDIPAGGDAGDLMVAVAGWKPYDTTISTPSGWSNTTGPHASGTTANGTGVGSIAAQAFHKTHSGTESSPTATPSNTYSPFMPAMVLFDKTVAGAWTVEATHGTSESTTLNVDGAASLSFAAGDMVAVLVVHKDDDANITAESLTASGVTFANLTSRATISTTSGNDGDLFLFTADVTVGGTATPNFTATVANSEGWATVLFIRVAEPAATIRTGAAAVAVAVSATATGVRVRYGAAAAGVAVTASAAGLRVRSGSAAVGVTVAASAAGVRTRYGTAAVAVTVGATSTGYAVRSATATAAVAVSATAVGARVTYGSGSGAVAVSATATGVRTKQGTANVAVELSATTTGTAGRFGAGTAQIVLAATAVGFAGRFATATAAVAVNATAAGAVTRYGTAAVSVAVDTSATGVRVAVGQGSAEITIDADAAAWVERYATAAAGLELAASASAGILRAGSASAAVEVDAVGVGVLGVVLVYDPTAYTLTGRAQPRSFTGRGHRRSFTGRHPHH